MKILIIGGSGFVGKRLTEYFIKDNHEVISYSRSKISPALDGCTYYQGDVTEYGTIFKILSEHKVDAIIQNAAISHPKLFTENPYKIYRTNVEGTLVSLEAARVFNVGKFVYISSGAVYGNTDLEIVKETAPLRGESAYGASKVACEEIVRNYGINSVSIRVGFVYGPGRVFECPINNLLSDVLSQGSANWETGADQSMDYAYIDDVVKGIALATLSNSLRHTEYNLGGGQKTNFSEVISIVKELLPEANINIGNGDLGFDNLGALDINRAYEDFNWIPEVTVKEGIKRYLGWMKNQ